MQNEGWSSASEKASGYVMPVNGKTSYERLSKRSS